MTTDTPILSIVTPAYNRGHLIRNCYASLKAQSCFDFEWIVVDDGSQDDTGAVMKQIIEEENSFSISYIRKENGGKHTALNAAHPYIRGSYVLILDSDDLLTPDAVETVLFGWEKFDNDEQVGVIRFAKQVRDGRVCSYAKDEYVKTDLLRYQRVFVASGDSCEVIRADLFRKFPFPVFGGERFLAETALWYRVGMEYACVYINKPIYICEYLEAGLTKSGKKLHIMNPRGGMFNSALRMHKRCPFKERVKANLLYCCYGFFAGLPVKRILKNADTKCSAVLSILPGYLIYRYWKMKYM